ncbi:MAG: hypothetical protein AAGG38_01485 [Planctomycetota bacterium]
MTTPARTPRWLTLHSIAAPLCAGLILLGLGAINHGFPTAEDAEPYHAEVLDAVDRTPLDFGPWAGLPVDLPKSAVELLRPNAWLSRSYVDPTARRRAEFLIVQCKDARDLSGHWPPNCYKANGYTAVGVQRRVWTLPAPGTAPGTTPGITPGITLETAPGTTTETAPGNTAGPLTISGVEYEFEIDTTEQQSRVVVANFMILPGVGFVPDMAGVREAGADPRRRALGAAQVQVVTDAAYSPAKRDAIFAEMIAAHLPAIHAIARHTPASADPTQP